ncbi:MAG TPA: glycosyltransferase family 4 protein [Patescibacteria group bacterium]|nr:glycosyltransferase family 4 protein [Patescibacteria group bacterium]
MRIGLYDPYLDTLGGGEKYMFDAAVCFSQSHDVAFFWPEEQKEFIVKQAKERFGLNIENVSFAGNVFNKKTSLLEKFLLTNKYDLIIYLSDGSIPFLFAKKNVLMFQHPVDWVKPGILTKIKLLKINKIICNSLFTKEHIDRTFNKDSLVVFPAAESVFEKGIKKENIILSVGRFTASMNAKKQDVLIDIFIKFSKKMPEWKLILAGGILDSDKEFLNSLKKKVGDFPIELMPNVSRTELISLYNRSKIYWHGAGFGENIEKHPERTEHFGIATVEAMSAGCVPIIFAAGGQKEIVENNENGLYWLTLEELEEKTVSVIQDKKMWEKLSLQAKEKAEQFSAKEFQQKLQSLL